MYYSMPCPPLGSYCAQGLLRLMITITIIQNTNQPYSLEPSGLSKAECDDGCLIETPFTGFCLDTRLTCRPCVGLNCVPLCLCRLDYAEQTCP
jgi:hypothetical protein